MKAAQFSRYGGPEVLEIVDLPDPHPGPGQVRIVVRAAGISGTDPKLRSGALSFGADLPQTTAHDVAGVVDELGEGVTDVAVGDRVYGVADTGAAAFHALATIGELTETGRFWLPVDKTFPLAAVAEAHRISEHGHVRGRLVLVVS